MSITPGKSSNSTGFLRETDLHLVTPSFVKVNRSTGQPWHPAFSSKRRKGPDDSDTRLPVWFLSVNVPASILLSRWLPTNRKCGAFHSKAACRHLHPSVLFLLLCKNVTAFVILAPSSHPPLRNQSKWRLHRCKNSSLYLLHKYTRSTAGFNK